VPKLSWKGDEGKALAEGKRGGGGGNDKEGAAAARAAGGGVMAGSGDLVSDGRFKTLHNDPRFMNFPEGQQKVKIDERFKKMFTDKSFSTGGNARGKTDKRGRQTPKAAKNAKNDLKEYYQLEEEDVQGASAPAAAADHRFMAAKAMRAGNDAAGEDEDEDEDVDEGDDDAEEEEEEGKGADESAKVKRAREAAEAEEMERGLEESRDRMRGVGLESSSDEEEADEDEEVADYEDHEARLPPLVPSLYGRGTECVRAPSTLRSNSRDSLARPGSRMRRVCTGTGTQVCHTL